MLSLFLLYAVLIFSSWMAVSTLHLPTRLSRWLMVSAAASAQLIFSMQLLSLVRKLDGPWLLGSNIALSALVWAIVRGRAKGDTSPPSTLVSSEVDGFGRLEWMGVIVCVCIVIFDTAFALINFPSADPYHFTMPIFWKQNGTMLPSPIYDPRINGVVFASEAISFPGVLFVSTGKIFVLVASLAAAGTLWIAAAIARLLGGSKRAAVCVAVVLAATSVFSTSLLGAQADILLSSMWLAGSLYLLLEASRWEERRTVLLAGSAFCFAMAAGTKNVILLHALPYGFAVLFLFGRWATRPQNAWRAFVLPAFAGVIASGVLWSYVSNQFWYHDARGHPFLKETLSKDFHVSAVWTKYCRAFVTFAFDITWIPPRYQPAFADICQRAVHCLGGRESLSEDSGFYAFEKNLIRPNQSLGLIGPLVIVPSLAFAMIAIARYSLKEKSQRTATQCVLIFGGASILIFVTVLRWQSVGIMRLMFSCAVCIMPLCCHYFRWRLAKLTALAVAALSFGICSMWGVALGLRRVDPTNRFALSRTMEKLQRRKPEPLNFHWQDGPVESVAIREPAWRRELYEHFLERIPQPTTFGIIGGYNAQVYWLFGTDYRNRIVPVNDCREDDAGSPPPPEVRYLVIEDFPVEDIRPQAIADFESWLEVDTEGRIVFRCLRRRQADATLH